MKVLWLLIALFPTTSFSHSFMPDNDLHLQDDVNREDANVTEEEFNRVIDQATDIYAPIITAHGATLNFNRLWSNSTVNASASQSGSTWTVNMYGGLARRPEVTSDGFALVVCHELGHHLGGFAMYTNRWASNEGQSDYFATLSCGRLLWRSETEKNAGFRKTVDAYPKAKCDATYETTEDQNLCYRLAMGGLSLAKLLAALGNDEISWETPDQNEVSATSDSHPAAQCRLDTYLAGSICTAEFDPNLIPGKSHPDGQRSIGAEIEAAANSCTRAALFERGARPRCWFKPNVTITDLVAIGDLVWEETSGNLNGVIEPGESFSITGSLVNNTRQNLGDLNAKITETSALMITSDETTFKNVQPLSTTLGTPPFQGAIPADVACGSQVSMTVQMDLMNTSQIFQKNAMVGALVDMDPQTMNDPMPIPDVSEIESSMLSTTQQADQLTIQVDISHTYVSDLTLTLVPPSGAGITLRARTGGSTDDIKESYDVDLSAVGTLAGNWTLKVEDSARADTGTLNSWSMVFKGYQCN